MCKDFTKIVQILYKYYANIAQIFGKYCANIGQKLGKYCTNIVQIEALGQTLQSQVQSSKSENSYKRHLVSELVRFCMLSRVASQLKRVFFTGCLIKKFTSLKARTFCIFGSYEIFFNNLFFCAKKPYLSGSYMFSQKFN